MAAEGLGIPVAQPEQLDETSDPGTDLVIVAAYGVLIPDTLLEKRLWLNVHPSLLPRWRGAAPVERAIMEGDRETGVTIHRTTAELDAGPIAAQASFELAVEDDAGAVYERAAPLAARLLGDLLGAGVGDIQFEEQTNDGATYAEKISPEDRELDWSRPASETVARVRALSPHIGAWGAVEGRRLIVWRARVAEPVEPDEVLRVGDVVLLDVQPEGRRRMSAEAYLRGLR